MGDTVHLQFAQNVPLASGVRLTDEAPFRGEVEEVLIHWPLGCNALVDVRCGHGNEQFLPAHEGEYLALDSAAPQFAVKGVLVADHEEIWVEILNRDGGWPHFITVVWKLTRREP